MAEVIGAVFCAIIAFIALVISIRSFKEKGFLFNNAYIWASEKERQQMDKKPHYRQTGIVFALITVIFCSMAIDFILKTSWLWAVNVGVAAIAIAYAIISTVHK